MYCDLEHELDAFVCMCVCVAQLGGKRRLVQPQYNTGSVGPLQASGGQTAHGFISLLKRI